MGAERWVRFASLKEANRFKQDLGSITELRLDDKFGCWFGWRKPTVLEIGHTLYFLNTMFADMLTQEICSRYNVMSIGADSVGWYKNSEMNGERKQKYKTWIDYFKDYSPKRDLMTKFLDEKELQEFEQEADELIQTLCLSS